ncbi:hypothetical protein AX16_008657 [Volvariella volvacea WC 439]|nr:hypothetical protein AX16_008657 [Volvariella volvacea WC 439]
MALLQEIDRRSNALSSQILPELQAYMVNRSTVGGNGVHNPSSQSRRESLSNLVKLSEDGLKASEEKVYLAQAAQDTVERHIRILDQAILELEIMISSDNLLGLNPAPFTLPDLTVPRWAKPSRVADSSDDESVQDGSKRERVNIDGDKVLRKKSSKRAPSHKGHSNQQSLPLKITLPGSSGLAISEEAHLDTRTYCYCNSVSFGEVC